MAAGDAAGFKTKKAPRVAWLGGSSSVQSGGACFQHADNIEELVLVAGAGFEPAAFRL
jgi:site-specific DNA recombinase